MKVKRCIKVTWKEKGVEYETRISRREFRDKMEDIMKTYEGNNEISTRFYKISEKVEEIRVDKDRYKTDEVPLLYYKNVEDEEYRGFSINKMYHPLMWKIFLGYCSV